MNQNNEAGKDKGPPKTGPFHAYADEWRRNMEEKLMQTSSHAEVNQPQEVKTSSLHRAIYKNAQTLKETFGPSFKDLRGRVESSDRQFRDLEKTMDKDTLSRYAFGQSRAEMEKHPDIAAIASAMYHGPNNPFLGRLGSNISDESRQQWINSQLAVKRLKNGILSWYRGMSSGAAPAAESAVEQ